MVMNLGKGQPNLTDVEISALGKLIYRQKIRPLMTEKDIGKYVIRGRVTAASTRLTRTCVEADSQAEGDGPPTLVGTSCALGIPRRIFIGWHEEPEL